MAEYFLVGDSHLGVIRQAFDEKGIAVAGDITQPGNNWHFNHWSYRNRNFSFSSMPRQAEYDAALAEVGAHDCAEVNVPFVTSIGYQTAALILSFPFGYRITEKGASWQFITTAVVEAWLMHVRRQHFAAIQDLRSMGKTIFAIVPPQREPDRVLADRINEIISNEFRRMGVIVIDLAAETSDGDGMLRREYHSEVKGDFGHANVAWGKLVIDAINSAR